MTDHIVARTGFFPIVAADEVSLTQAGSSAVFSGGDVSLAQAGSNFMLTAGSASIKQGGAITMAALGDVAIEEGGGVIIGAGSVDVTNGFVGIALGRNVSLTDCRLLLGPAQAAAVGAGLGLVLLLGRLLGRSS